LDKYDRKELREIISDLQTLYDLAMENCTKKQPESGKMLFGMVD